MKTHENKNLIHTVRDFILNEIISLNFFPLELIKCILSNNYCLGNGQQNLPDI